MCAAGYPVLHMNALLTYDIVANESCLYAVHVKVQGFKYRIVHISLTSGASVSQGLLTDMGTHTSPLWKSTMEAGTKAPCMHAIAPIPVELRWLLCLFTLFTARWSWHVDLCQSLSKRLPKYEKSSWPATSQLPTSDATCTVLCSP